MLDPNPEERPTASQVLEDLKFFEPRPVIAPDRKVRYFLTNFLCIIISHLCIFIYPSPSLIFYWRIFIIHLFNIKIERRRAVAAIVWPWETRRQCLDPFHPIGDRQRGRRRQTICHSSDPPVITATSTAIAAITIRTSVATVAAGLPCRCGPCNSISTPAKTNYPSIRTINFFCRPFSF